MSYKEEINVAEGLKCGELKITSPKKYFKLNFRGVNQDVVIDFRGCTKKELNIELDGQHDEKCDDHEVTIIIDGLDLKEFVCTGRYLSWIVKFSANGCKSLEDISVHGTAVLSGFVGCPITTVDISGNLMEQLGYFTKIKKCKISCVSESEFYPDSLPYSCTHLRLIQPPFPQNLDERDAVSDESDEAIDPDMDFRYRGYGIPKSDKKKCLSAKYVSDISDLKDRCPKLKEFTTNSMIVIPDKD